ncbi:MAG: hypothetical protein OER43_18805, partial [Gammaproteobacteria bacterium]|nr:hypothetical protein [Gammaproteobacteria bacterium]
APRALAIRPVVSVSAAACNRPQTAQSEESLKNLFMDFSESQSKNAVFVLLMFSAPCRRRKRRHVLVPRETLNKSGVS